jgi:hypothetical protein
MLNDIALDDDGDLLFIDGDLQLINGIYYVKQQIKRNLQFFLGELFIDLTVGLPYFQKILIKNPNKLDVVNYIKRTILLTEGVKSIESFDIYRIENEPRAIGVRGHTITSYGVVPFDEIYTVS